VHPRTDAQIARAFSGSNMLAMRVSVSPQRVTLAELFRGIDCPGVGGMLGTEMYNLASDSPSP
jgi:hypothetical protein